MGETIRLKVKEACKEDVMRGIARIDAQARISLDAEPQEDVILIKGKKQYLIIIRVLKILFGLKRMLKLLMN